MDNTRRLFKQWGDFLISSEAKEYLKDFDNKSESGQTFLMRKFFESKTENV